MWNQFHYSQNRLALYKAMALISGGQRKTPLFQKQRRFSTKPFFHAKQSRYPTQSICRYNFAIENHLCEK
jgi:hypothetical protein